METIFNDNDPLRRLQSDFFVFHHNVLKELERHFPEKGLGYRETTWSVPRSIFKETEGEIDTETQNIEIPATEGFRRDLERAFDEWRTTRDPSQLLDISALCGMLWFHETGYFKNDKGAH